VGAEAEIVLPKPAAVLVPPFRSCKPAALDGGTRCRILMNQNLLNVTFKKLGIVQADED
jgi:hypothetical protein